MSTTKTQKSGGKSVGKPLIRKIYDTQKRWLGNERAPTRTKRDVVIIHKKTNHTYENVEYKKNEETSAKLEENVSIVSVDFDRTKSDKLRIVIDNFDKILDSDKSNPNATSTPIKATPQLVTEAPPKKDTKIPKLVKAKTCSIIESKCILKKSNSQPLGGATASGNNAACNKLQNKTKSMSNIDTNLNCDQQFKLTKPGAAPAKVAEKSPTKVKEMVKRLNSLTEVTPNQEPDSPKPSELNTKLTMSKARSTLDLCPSKKNLSLSKIPVNTTLRKSYPSIPCDLNNLDLDRGSAGAKKLSGKFAKSVQNLTQAAPRLSLPRPVNNLTSLDQVSSKLSLPRSGKNLGRSVQNLSQIGKLSVPKTMDKSDKTRSVQNLSNVGKLTVPKTMDKSAGKSVQNLSSKPPSATSTRSSAKVVQNLQKRDFVNAGQRSEVKPKTKSIKDLTLNFDNSKEKRVVKPMSKAQSKLGQTSKDAKPKDEIDSCVSVSKTMSTVKKLSSKLKEEDVSPKDTFVVLKAPKEERVKSVVEKLEDTKDKSGAKPRLLKTDTFKKVATFPVRSHEVVKVEDNSRDDSFGAQKDQFEPRFVEKSLKNNKGTYRKPRVDTVKLDLKKTQEFLSTVKITSSFYLDPEDFTDVKVEKVINYLQEEGQMKKLDLSLDETMKKDLDYNSDNSDDSGNISNEMELDCDDTNSSSSSVKSEDSTESLNTVLDVSVVGQDSGLGISKRDFSLDENEKIFFRNGVVSQLETQRDERLAGMVVHLQAHCRGYLARRRLTQKKLQDLAVRCIQRNVRKFLAVRDWPWWRLLVRVTPLLNVHRTEEELRIKTDELEAIKIKLDKSENDRTKLKHENDKLEAKVSFYPLNCCCE